LKSRFRAQTLAQSLQSLDGESPMHCPIALIASCRVRVLLALAILASTVWSAAAQSEASQYFETLELPVGREKHGAAVVGDYLYVFGGEVLQPDGTTAFTAASSFAPIRPDGQIGTWRATSPLPAAIAYIGNSVIVRGRVIYIAGGSVRQRPEATGVASRIVLMAAQLSEGQLSAWIPSDPFPGPPLVAAAAVATSTHLYVLGGANTDDNPNAVVYIAPFTEGGLLGAWSRGPDLPQSLWFHMAGIVGDRMYVWGGTNQAAGPPGSVADTMVAQIRSDGTLSDWQPLNPLPRPMYFSAQASIDDTLYNFSGRFADSSFTSDVLFCIPEPGEPFQWQRVRANVPMQRYLAPAVDHRRGIIYFPGGRSEDIRCIQDVYGYRVPRVEEVIAEVFEPGQRPTQTVTPPETVVVSPPTDLSGEWLPYYDAEFEAQRTGDNLMIYFHTPQARLCRELEENVFESPSFAPIAQRHTLTRVNAAENRELAVTYGVFRVPTVVIVDPVSGQPIRTFVRDITLRDLAASP
jgi:Kelch motif